MRLLHSQELYFEEFFDSDVPEYAILSHRWEDSEVSFLEFEVEKAKWNDIASFKRHYSSRESQGTGFWKIFQCCFLAQTQGAVWVWIDTCCIDKSSSAEVSEAINSMYRWYKNSKHCYVYISDVLWQSNDAALRSLNLQQFAQSRWFTRGWTLQELLAPVDVRFYDCEWNFFDTKAGMLKEISEITGIGVKQLDGTADACVAAKMSWLSGRQTSRIEDIAYCMLGIFDVNMPLLYGEGMKAFMRLQLEIIKSSDDESIFAWADPQKPVHGMLATTPAVFADSGDIFIREDVPIERLPYAMTNKGLEFKTFVRNWAKDSHAFIDVGLHCWRTRGSEKLPVVISLQKVGMKCVRIECDELKLRKSIYTSVRRFSSIPWDAADAEITLYIAQDEI